MIERFRMHIATYSRKVVIVLQVFFCVLLLFPDVQCQKKCNERANTLGSGAGQDPIDCAGDDNSEKIKSPNLKIKTTNGYTVVDQSLRTNSIQDFCIFSDIHGATAPTPTPLGYAPANCYPTSVPSAAPPVSHSAGPDPNWAILEHLTQHKAQSFQPFDDLPYTQPFRPGSGSGSSYYEDEFLVMDPIYTPNPLPTPLSPNPYFIEVTGISVKGELLQNFLHFRIFANLSVALSQDQIVREKVLHGKNEQGPERPNFAKGKISALLIMVKDQHGWPIGDFSTPIPCWRTCSKYSHDVFYGDERNAVPCSYTPPFATKHPGMFVFDVDPGRYCTMNPHNTTAPPSPTPPNPPTDPRLSAHTARLEGVREVHATWSFGHDTCNFVQRIFIQTLIFEDVETVYNAYFVGNAANPPTYDQHILFGWTAQYNILKTTRGTLGAPDYVDLKYLRERDARGNDVNCHVPLFDSTDTVPFSFQKLPVPSHELIGATDSGDPLYKQILVPYRLAYLARVHASFVSNKDLRYFGQHNPVSYPGNTNPMCRGVPNDVPLSHHDQKAFKAGQEIPVMKKFLTANAESVGVRCPCPALASTLPPENRTADPARLHGRLIHASHMGIAYMLLTPIACFVVRYYKETFITVFCFQEYWWYMWHVVILIAACLFNVGAITSLARNKDQELVYTQNLTVHIILGAMSIFVFYMEIITGFFRVANAKKRMRQIFMHWLIGMTNNGCAVVSMYAMAWVDQSGFSCNVAYTVTFWVVFVLTCYVVMEVNLRKTDKKLRLVPRRTYLPPPVKRLFTKEPPGRAFRLGMLAIFIIGLIIIQFFFSYHMWDVDKAASCEQEYRLLNGEIKNFDDELIDEGDENEGGGDGEDTSY